MMVFEIIFLVKVKYFMSGRIEKVSSIINSSEYFGISDIKISKQSISTIPSVHL